MYPSNGPLVSTIKELCRVCFTCVRECPAKAIRIVDQQAEIIPERCIGCGNCVKVCSQRAKRVISDIGTVTELLDSPDRVVACLAPSFPAEFVDIDYQRLVGMLRKIGFDMVVEVSFGADLVAAEYKKLLEKDDGRRYIATTCPAAVGFVERYQPDLVDSLAPIVSPMIATARAIRELEGADLKVVFIGPCIAKKGEATSGIKEREIDAALTFVELRELLSHKRIKAEDVEPSDFDPPHGGYGSLFPINRGMLQAAEIAEDFVTGDVVAADGRLAFVEAIREFQAGYADVRLLEVLCCNGCIMGPGIGQDSPLYRRRMQVSRYVRQRLQGLDRGEWWKSVLELCSRIDMTRKFASDDQRIAVPSELEITQILVRMGKTKPEDELNCGACGYETCREHAIAIHKGLAESEMCLPYTIEQLKTTCGKLTLSNKQLATAQEALMQSEKLASMGQLAAGIAHEVNNPLGTVLMLSHVLLDEAEVGSELREDLEMIATQADRCKKIVAGLLHFARKNKVEARSGDLLEIVEQTIRAIRRPPHVELKLEKENSVEMTAEFDHDQITQVLNNLASNGMAAMPNGGVLTIRTGGDERNVFFSVSDTGVGIPEDNLKKIFDPFFTTKRVGEGTGLGLAVSYGIAKMHNGDINVKSNADPAEGPTGTTFTVTLPRKRPSREATAEIA